MTPPALRVMTYNLRAFRDDWRAAAEVVRTVGPDVLCLQEVSRTWFPTRRTRAFARACALEWPAGRVRGGGTTVLVRPGLPVTRVSHHRLHVGLLQGAREGVRGYAVVRVVVEGVLPVTVASVHLSLTPEERVRHARLLRPGLPGRGALVIAGDINEDDAGEAWQLLSARGRTRLVSPLRPTFPASAPTICLDAVFASSELEPLPPVQTALDETLLARGSDHRPVWCDLRGRSDA